MEQPKNNFKIVSDKKARMLLPNALTLINVCIGLSSIKFALDAKFELSIIAIIFAAIFDTLDGRVARMLKGTSLVGKELDSLADLISFGVAPAFIMYFWSLNNLGKFGWLLTMIFVVCVALRLARFNVSSNSETSWRDNYFEGVPSPFVAVRYHSLVAHTAELDQRPPFERHTGRLEQLATHIFHTHVVCAGLRDASLATQLSPHVLQSILEHRLAHVRAITLTACDVCTDLARRGYTGRRSTHSQERLLTQLVKVLPKDGNIVGAHRSALHLGREVQGSKVGAGFVQSVHVTVCDRVVHAGGLLQD